MALEASLAPQERESAEPWSWVPSFLEKESYRAVKLPKPTGGWRELEIPSDGLLSVQRKLAIRLSRAFLPTGPACAYAPGRNVVLHAAAHREASVIVQLDLKGFFHSIRPSQVRNALLLDEEQEHAWLNNRTGVYLPGLDERSREAILDLCFRSRGGSRSLAQGAPTSPVLSNIAAAAFDHRVRRWGNNAFGKGEWTYTRYADDIVISLRTEDDLIKQRVVDFIERLAQAFEWRLNHKKTRVWAESMTTTPQICGIVLAGPPGDRRPALNRDARRRARAAARALSGTSPHRNTDEVRRAEGTLSWAYTVTGDARYLGLMSTSVRDIADQLATARGTLDAEGIAAGWAAGIPGYKPVASTAAVK